jgi:hypothetical protein
MKSSGILVVLLLFLVLSSGNACTGSRVIKVTVTNTSTEKLSMIMIDYPDATFGINSLEAGKSFEYKIKPTSTGALRIEFVNSHGVGHVAAGPVVHKNDQGSIQVRVTQDGATSEIALNRRT